MAKTGKSGETEYVSVEIPRNDLANSIKEKLCRELPHLSEKCIWRVPQRLRKCNKKAYDPKIISIGPYHHGNKDLHPMEMIKSWYLQSLLDRLPWSPEETLAVFVEDIRGLQSCAEGFYADKYESEVVGDKFVEMLILDGCFLVELFRKDAWLIQPPEDDPVFSSPWMLSNLYHDLILLENQIPWVVLLRLFQLSEPALVRAPREGDNDILAKLVLKFFERMMLLTEPAEYKNWYEIKQENEIKHRYETKQENEIKHKYKTKQENEIKHRYEIRHVLNLLPTCLFSSSAKQENETEQENEIEQDNEIKHRYKIKHVLHLLHNCLLSSSPTPTTAPDTDLRHWKLVHPVTDLLLSGVKFKKGSPGNILNIKFSNGVFEIPPIRIRGNSEALFQNLIAYEECNHLTGHWFTSYAVLLDYLIHTSADVESLCDKEIIVDALSTEDIALFCNGLYNETLASHFYFGELTEDLDKYYRSRWPRCRNTVMSKHFKSSWSVLSLVAGIFILLFTFTQTLFGILSY